MVAPTLWLGSTPLLTPAIQFLKLTSLVPTASHSCQQCSVGLGLDLRLSEEKMSPTSRLFPGQQQFLWMKEGFFPEHAALSQKQPLSLSPQSICKLRGARPAGSTLHGNSK